MILPSAGCRSLFPLPEVPPFDRYFEETVRKMTVFEKKTNKFVEEKACQFGKSVVT